MTTPDAAPMDDGNNNDIDQPSLEAIKRHDKFYTLKNNAMSIFLVERTLYRVDRYFLTRESSVFRTMFDCPHPVEGQDGESDEKPIHLRDVSCSEFEILLNFFHYGMFTFERQMLTGPINPNVQQKNLYNLLSIFLLYDFDRVTTELVAFIDGIRGDANLVTKIRLGLAHDCLRHWVGPAFAALIQRCDSLTEDEIIQLGMRRSTIVGRMRETYLRNPRWGESLKMPPNFISV